ncbi:hypothetical protein IAR55_006260 [Kwoniella newhampshirensis]|uniref:UDP-N-acetylglucosamine--dolichyl-phosphate N-acetylglucosaminephosphotransferase n=1 Tax=Kwoniella newhampshirensis TaxID=1651941 RepID=A0AAW0YV16_9TREE
MTQTYGHPPPVLLTATLVPISLLLIANPLLPILLPPALTDILPLPHQPTLPALQANIGFALLAFVGAVWTVPQIGGSFVGKGLKGRDLLKPGGRTSGPWVPESLGLPCASWYIALMMLFIPFPFSHLFKGEALEQFPQRELTLYLSSLLSLLTATLLGFIDDLFDIRWRHKLPIPIIAAVPTLLVYYSVGGVTSVVLPKGVTGWLQSTGLGWWIDGNVVDLGPIYYLYLILLPTFTTNSINILAGINGVEVTQALIIAFSVAFNDLLYLPIWPEAFLRLINVGNPNEGRILEWAAGEVVDRHLMSLYFMAPLVGVCAGFLWHNWYDPDNGLLNPSRVVFEKPPPVRTRVTLQILEVFGLVKLERIPVRSELTKGSHEEHSSHEAGQIISSTNLTIINFLLVHFGPMHERSLCMTVGAVQVACSGIAFGIRYGVGAWFYGGERR